MPNLSAPSNARVSWVTGFAAGLLLIVPAPTLAQASADEPPDPAELIEEARERQRDFELFRQSRIPVERERAEGSCDERIGRICIWFGGEGEERFPAELSEVRNARIDLIRFLTDVTEEVPDRWILGQLVHYLVENRNVGEAERMASECGIDETWWCSALRGYVLHVRTEYVEAEQAFREALAAMPEDERDRWLTPRYVFTPDGEDEFNRADPQERRRQWELFWRLSDPLFLFEGNDRLTDHLARWVEARNRDGAEHPQGMEWDEDMEATLVRYGRIMGYSRTYDPSSAFGGGGIRDTRRVVGHHHPKSRGYLFPESFLESPSDIPPESWITAPREARTWYAPPYAPEVRGLETQVGRFRRGDEMLVVGAYRPTLPAPEANGPVVPAWDREEGVQGPAYAALFLVPEDGEEADYVQGSEPEGVLTLQAWPGRYVSSLEVVDLEGRQAWRARQGVAQLPLVLGQVDVSDLLILKEGTPLPETLEDAIPDVRPGVRVRRGERFPVVWEMYGLGIQEPVRVTLGFTRGRPGFLTRVGEFLGVLEEEDRPVEVTFEDAGPDVVQSAFRSIELELPDLEPGDYTLHLRLDLAGRTPLVISRPIIVEG
jgi:hypothetical protein